MPVSGDEGGESGVVFLYNIVGECVLVKKNLNEMALENTKAINDRITNFKNYSYEEYLRGNCWYTVQ